MENVLVLRVKERLAAVGINPFEAARRAGFERSYINDLLIGKKQNISRKKLPALAGALECDEKYLVGMQDTPVAANVAPVGSLTLKGYAEADVWRPIAPAPERTVPIAPVPQYAPGMQVAYIVRGDHADGFSLPEGMILIAVGGLPPREGDVVIARREREGAREVSVRVVRGDVLIGAPKVGELAPLKRDEVEVAGVVVAAMRLFGPST